jgi:hypothetical protein
VVAVSFQFTQRISDSADACWETIRGKPRGPTCLIYSSERLYTPIALFEDSVASGFPVRLKGQLKNCMVCILEGGNPETLILWDENMFDLATNGYRFGPPTKSPQFNCRTTTVGRLFAGIGATCSGRCTTSIPKFPFPTHGSQRYSFTVGVD